MSRRGVRAAGAVAFVWLAAAAALQEKDVEGSGTEPPGPVPAEALLAGGAAPAPGTFLEAGAGGGRRRRGGRAAAGAGGGAGGARRAAAGRGPGAARGGPGRRAGRERAGRTGAGGRGVRGRGPLPMAQAARRDRRSQSSV